MECPHVKGEVVHPGDGPQAYRYCKIGTYCHEWQADWSGEYCDGYQRHRADEWQKVAVLLGEAVRSTCEQMIQAYSDQPDEYRRGQHDTAHHILHTWAPSKALKKLAELEAQR